jgi:hypothetical protein
MDPLSSWREFAPFRSSGEAVWIEIDFSEPIAAFIPGTEDAASSKELLKSIGVNDKTAEEMLLCWQDAQEMDRQSLGGSEIFVVIALFDPPDVGPEHQC